MITSGALRGAKRAQRSITVRKFGHLPIPEILVITCPLTPARPSARPGVRPHHRRTNVNNSINPNESIKTKTESGNCLCICVVMSTNLEYTAWERQRKRQSRRRKIFMLEKQHENFVVAVRKWELLAATNAKWKWAAAKKNKNEREHSSVSTEELFSLITEASSWIHFN